MAIMAGLFLILPMAFKSSAPKKQESVPSEGENADENAEIKAGKKIRNVIIKMGIIASEN